MTGREGRERVGDGEGGKEGTEFLEGKDEAGEGGDKLDEEGTGAG